MIWLFVPTGAAERSNYRVGIAIALNTIGLVTSKQGKRMRHYNNYSNHCV